MGTLDPLQGMQYLQSKGWSANAAAGMLGNASAESAFNPYIKGDGGAAHGLFQTHTKWHPGYDRNFNATQQLDFASWELKTRYPDLAQKMNNARTPQEAAMLFMKGYEKPANYSSASKRAAAAMDIANKSGSNSGPGLIDQAKGLADDLARGADALLLGGTVFGITDTLGITGDCNIFCQFKNWITESGFFQRVALAVLAFIILFAAFSLLKSSQN